MPSSDDMLELARQSNPAVTKYATLEAGAPDADPLRHGHSRHRFRRVLSAATVALIVLAAAGTAFNEYQLRTNAPDTPEACARSFEDAVSASSPNADWPESSLQPPRDGEAAWATLRGADDWNGDTPLCVVSYTGSSGCRVFLYDAYGVLHIPGDPPRAEWFGYPSGYEQCPDGPQVPAGFGDLPADWVAATFDE